MKPTTKKPLSRRQKAAYKALAAAGAFSKMGRTGGRKTVDRHGSEHMAEIGRTGGRISKRGSTRRKRQDAGKEEGGQG